MENEEQKKEEYLNKNITLFLYEKVKNGKLDPKYVPDKYLEAIKERSTNIKRKQYNDLIPII